MEEVLSVKDCVISRQPDRRLMDEAGGASDAKYGVNRGLHSGGRH